MLHNLLRTLLFSSCFLSFLFVSGQGWNQIQKVLPPTDATSPIGGQSDRVGWSVAADSNTIITGAPESDINGSGSGAVFVYMKLSGVWTYVGQLGASDGSPEADFGWSLDVSGDRMAIGAPGDSPGGIGSAGSVYIFEWIGNTWVETDKIISDSPTSSDKFGYSVSLDGDRVLIGTPEDDDLGNGSGSAYLFEIIAGSWTQVAKLTGSDAAVGDNFGLSVSLSGEQAVCGSYLHDAGGSNRGAAYVFQFNAGNWTQSQKIVAPDAGDGDRLGVSVSVDASLLAIGASQDDDGGTNAGAVYLYDLIGNTWTYNSKIVANDASANDLFGQSVSMSGTTLAVGSYQEDEQASNSGASYVYIKSGTWGLQQKVTASDGAADDFFGYSVAISGNTLATGARGDDESGNDSGSIYIHVRSGSTWAFDLKGTANDMIDDPSLDQFGYAVAISGDNAVVGAYQDDDQGIASGSIRFYQYNGSTWQDEGKFYSSDIEQEDFFGFRVAMSGNTALVSAYGDDDLGLLSGAVYVFERINDEWQEVQKLTASDGEGFDNFGYSLAIEGNRAVIGSHLDDDFGNFSGSVYVFDRVGGVWTETQKLLPNIGAEQDQFGTSVDLEGDMIVVGARNESSTMTYGGAAYLFEKSGTSWSQVALLKPNDDSANKLFGSAVSISEGTIVVGAIGDNSGESSSGAAYVFSNDGLSWIQTTKLKSDQPGSSEYFGSAVDNEGKILAIGSYRSRNSDNISAGAVFIIDGTSDTTWVQTQKLIDSEGGLSDYYGNTLDLDGTRLFIGVPLDDDNGMNSGSAFFYAFCSGNPGSEDPQCNGCNPMNTTTDMSVVEIGFGTANARVNGTWNNPNGTTDCEVRGGRIAPSSIGTDSLQFSNINNTQVISQTDGSTVLFNIVLYNNPSVPFVIGHTYGFEVRCLCQDESEYTNWSGIIPEATFVVPAPPPALEDDFSKRIASADGIELFPNPIDGSELSIRQEGNFTEWTEWRIMDMSGRVVLKGSISQPTKDNLISLSFNDRLNSGVYFIQLASENDWASKRFIVE